jgi:aspartyl-tRNA synthetase
MGAGGMPISQLVYRKTMDDDSQWIEKIKIKYNLECTITIGQYHELNQFLGIEDNDVIFFGQRPDTFTVLWDKLLMQGGSTPLGRARSLLLPHLIEKLILQITPDDFKFLWVTDFPLFSPDLHDTNDPGQGGFAGIRSTHHPFTAPQVQDLGRLASHPLDVKGQHYDLVVNGVELGGGSVRIHDADLRHHVLHEILKVVLLVYWL